jgi:hypothetical protein
MDYPYLLVDCVLTDHLVRDSTPHQPAKLGVVPAPGNHARRVDAVNDRVASRGSHYKREKGRGGLGGVVR